MADYNTFMDKLNTDTEIDDILTDYGMVRNVSGSLCSMAEGVTSALS